MIIKKNIKTRKYRRTCLNKNSVQSTLVMSILEGFSSCLKFFHLNNTDYRYFLHYFLLQAMIKLFFHQINE